MNIDNLQGHMRIYMDILTSIFWTSMDARLARWSVARNKLKKAALHVIAGQMTDAQIKAKGTDDLVIGRCYITKCSHSLESMS